MDRAHAHPLPPRDPVTGGSLVITELQGVESEIVIRGRFEVPRFARLSPDQAKFLETFLRCRGMLNSVERELGISYPTARARLDAVLRALDLHAVREEASPTRPATGSEEGVPPTAEPVAEPTTEAEAPAESEYAQNPWEAPVEEPLGFDTPAETNDEYASDEAFAPAESFESSTMEEASEDASPSEPEPPRRSRDEILSMLERGELTVEDVKRELGRK